MSLNDDVIEVEKPNGICSHTFIVNDFPVLFLHPVFCIKDYEIGVDNKGCFIWFLVSIKL